MIGLKKMRKETEFLNILHDLRRNYPIGITTFSTCLTTDCSNPARGGGYCANCCEKQMAEFLKDSEIASAIHFATKLAHTQISKALNLIE